MSLVHLSSQKYANSTDIFPRRCQSEMYVKTHDSVVFTLDEYGFQFVFNQASNVSEVYFSVSTSDLVLSGGFDQPKEYRRLVKLKLQFHCDLTPQAVGTDVTRFKIVGLFDTIPPEAGANFFSSGTRYKDYETLLPKRTGVIKGVKINSDLDWIFYPEAAEPDASSGNKFDLYFEYVANV